MKRIRSQSTAFTLIELVLVLAMLALLMSLAAPSLRGWGRGARMRNASDQLLTATRWARQQAISTAVVHRLEVDPEGTAFRVVPRDAEQFADAPPAESVPLHPSLRMEIIRPDGKNGAIEFYPNGRVTPAVIRLSAEWGEEQFLQARTPADSFRSTVDAGGAP